MDAKSVKLQEKVILQPFKNIYLFLFVNVYTSIQS